MFIFMIFFVGLTFGLYCELFCCCVSDKMFSGKGFNLNWFVSFVFLVFSCYNFCMYVGDGILVFENGKVMFCLVFVLVVLDFFKNFLSSKVVEVYIVEGLSGIFSFSLKYFSEFVQFFSLFLRFWLNLGMIHLWVCVVVWFLDFLGLSLVMMIFVFFYDVFVVCLQSYIFVMLVKYYCSGM